MLKLVGGSGFIGTRLAGRLAEAGTPFEILDVQPSAAFPDRSLACDVRDLDALRRGLAGGETVVHLAAEHRDDVRQVGRYTEVNVAGSRNVAAAAEANGVDRIVFTSTVATYGFAPPNTDESGAIRPFNEYGRTKALAEDALREWQARGTSERSLVIVRPTVVFGERNRGNVYNLLEQIARGRFLMVGGGGNVKSMAYVENVAAFLQHVSAAPPGVHVYNYVDKPDMTVGALVRLAREELGRGSGLGPAIPYAFAYAAGLGLDGVARLTGRRFPISAIRIKKFTATTQFATAAASTGFVAPVPLEEALRRTIRHEFLEENVGPVYVTE